MRIKTLAFMLAAGTTVGCGDSTTVDASIAADTFQLYAIHTVPIPTKTHIFCKYEVGSPSDMVTVNSGSLILRSDSTYRFEFKWTGDTSTCAPAGVEQRTTYSGPLKHQFGIISLQFGPNPEDRFDAVPIGSSRIDLPSHYYFVFIDT